jgi:hypothetical protein
VAGIIKMQSRFERNEKTGAVSLVVHYVPKLDNYLEAIEKGLNEHSLKYGEIQVIALPKGHGSR